MEKQRALIKLFLKIAFFDSLKCMGLGMSPENLLPFAPSSELVRRTRLQANLSKKSLSPKDLF
jgi:hypothetical protein